MKIQIQKKTDFDGHRDCVYSLENSLEENAFFSASGDGMVVKWNLNDPENGLLIAKLPNSIYAMRILESTNKLLLAQNFEGLHEIDLNINQEVRTLKLANSFFFDIQIFENIALIACGNGQVAVIDLENFIQITTLSKSNQSARSIAINPLVKEFAVGYSDHIIRIFSLVDFTLIKEIKYHSNSVFTINYSNDYNFLYSAGRDAHVAIWDCWNHYEAVTDIAAHNFAINHLIFSPDNRYFMTASMDKTIKIWLQEDFKLLKVLDKTRAGGHSSSVNKLLWTKFPNQFLSTGDDKKITLWQIE